MLRFTIDARNPASRIGLRWRKYPVPEPMLVSGPTISYPFDPATAVFVNILISAPQREGSATDRTWKTKSTEVFLILDVIKACGGHPVPASKGILSATLPGVHGAFICARRIIWALQGLAENERFKTIRTTILIDVEKIPPDFEAAALDTETTETDRILITGRIAESLRNLPGISISEEAEGPYREAKWQGEKREVAAIGTEIPAHPVLATASLPEELEKTTEYPRITFQTPAPIPALRESHNTGDEIYSRKALDQEEGHNGGKGKFAWIAAAVLVGAMVLGYSIFHQKPSLPKASSAPVETIRKEPIPEPPHPSKPKPRVKPDQAPQILSSASASETALTPTKGRPTNSGAQNGSCELSQAQIDWNMQRAERDLHDGNLSEAEAAYRLVLNCPGAHEKAQQGLKMTKDRMDAQGPSGNLP
jgi:hypothetical protein